MLLTFINTLTVWILKENRILLERSVVIRVWTRRKSDPRLALIRLWTLTYIYGPFCPFSVFIRVKPFSQLQSFAIAEGFTWSEHGLFTLRTAGRSGLHLIQLSRTLPHPLFTCAGLHSRFTRYILSRLRSIPKSSPNGPSRCRRRTNRHSLCYSRRISYHSLSQREREDARIRQRRATEIDSIQSQRCDDGRGTLNFSWTEKIDRVCFSGRRQSQIGSSVTWPRFRCSLTITPRTDIPSHGAWFTENRKWCFRVRQRQSLRSKQWSTSFALLHHRF